MYERLLTDFTLTSTESLLTLTNTEGFVFTLSLTTPLIIRTTLHGPDRPLPPHDNFRRPLPEKTAAFQDLSIDEKIKRVTFTLQDGKHVQLDYSYDLVIAIHEIVDKLPESDSRRKRLVYQTLPGRGFVLNEHGVTRYNRIIFDALHFGLGEKTAPMDLTGRGFELTGTDAAAYDAYQSDPLYKHTPFLITVPRPISLSSPKDNLLNHYFTELDLTSAKDGSIKALNSKDYTPVSPYAIYHASNSDGVWDIRRSLNDPQGVFSKYIQSWGGLEEFLILGHTDTTSEDQYAVDVKLLKAGLTGDKPVEGQTQGVRDLVRAFAGLVGNPKLVPRDWLGYLASGMGIGESDTPIAQELLENWPDECEKYDIPCSGMHLSSGYTVGEDGNRYVFGMCKRRYPDFRQMVKKFHERGIKIVPNIKPYVLSTHPDYPMLEKAGALFYNPWTKKQVMAPIWSAGVGVTAGGSWVDMTHPVGRKWWFDGAKSLAELGCDGMWNDNNEYLLHNDDYVPAWDEGSRKTNAFEGKTNVGTLGRMYNTQLMAQMSHDACLSVHPERRPFVLTRSGNVGTFKYAASTWSGDNYTSWKTLQGAVATGLNAGLSLMQSYGGDVGGFAGPLPSPELFVRWIQFGCTNSRFCIHSFKPNKDDLDGSLTNNLPWMYPEVLPIIRQVIKRRYELLPYFNSLNWESHLLAEPPNSYLGTGPYASDPILYSSEILNGFDYWLGTGRLLIAGAYFEAQTKKKVYFPQAYPGDTTPYIRVTTQETLAKEYQAGTWAEVEIPLDEFAVFARAGSVIPVGRDQVTVTAIEGPARSCVGGTEIQITSKGEESSSGIALDDYRGIEIFPPRQGQDFIGSGVWVEDDGVSLNPKTTVISVEYKVVGEEIEVTAKFVKREFDVAWGNKLSVILPVGDARAVKGAQKKTRRGRTVFEVTVA